MRSVYGFLHSFWFLGSEIFVLIRKVFPGFSIILEFCIRPDAYSYYMCVIFQLYTIFQKKLHVFKIYKIFIQSGFYKSWSNRKCPKFIKM